MNTISYAAPDGTSTAYTPTAAGTVTFTLTGTGPSGSVSATTQVTVAEPLAANDCGGTLRTGSVTHQTTDGVTHTYYYRIPARAPPSDGRPVLFWLHGDGGNGNGYGSGFYPHTDADGAVLITPSGINNTWTHAAADLAAQPKDSQFISWIIDDIIANGVAGCATVNASRIYLGGESRGAYMPYFLMQRSSTKSHLAAVAVNAGLLYCQAGDAECEANATSATRHNASAAVLHLHGTNDTAVSPAPTSSFHQPVDWSVDWRVFSPMKFFAEQNGCFNSGQTAGNNDGLLRETTTIGGKTARRYDLSRWGAACSRYQLMLVTDGGHVIGGQHARIWTFLKQYSLP
jgi:poly(3-hydroxybutyrate) depolymerase